MFACEKLWQINSGHADTHTNISTLFEILGLISGNFSSLHTDTYCM